MPRGKPRSKLSEQDFPYDTVKKIVGYSLDLDTNLVTLTVLSKNNRVEVSEWDIQEHLPDLLYNYWASFKGKTRQDVLGIGELYHPYRCLKHRRVRGQWQVLVQWLGYSAEGDDVSWEPVDKTRLDAPDVLIDYCNYVDDENTKAALLGFLRTDEVAEEAKPVVETANTPAKQSAKRKRESLADQSEIASDKRRRSSRYESTPVATRTPAPKTSTSKRRQSQPPAAAASQTTPKSARRQSKIPSSSDATLIASPVRAQVPARRKSTRASSVAPNAAQSERLSPADIPRTMLWFMDDFTVGDMQKVCRFIDEHCTGKLRLPLYSGGDWDGKAASGRWEDVFMVSPLGRLGRYDNEEDKEE
ncbi:hypothetical protein CkaCkLH20_04377 [Colletotrichum karsti]|uniref:Chromo domain-containing protein n=1 Tax=Colletotrichum karsti TaxID=1095194 RepID=A0A9P6LJG2_9PEZI|nr:uncharacterized protein CkaCkLH20_04377 [Colletotrichum karsti]KAF9878339.1 hypothetical protein CkaCkLH20_04377 [Colletotrichum karsti]